MRNEKKSYKWDGMFTTYQLVISQPSTVVKYAYLPPLLGL